MDIWNWLWVLAFPALLVGAWFTITNMGKRALSRHLSEKTPEPDPKTLLAEVRRIKEAEKAQWQKDFQAILQKTCTHRFDGNAWAGWWKCLDCGYEQEWEYSGGCACRSAYDRLLTDVSGTHVLLERSRFCTLHGRDAATAPLKRLEDLLRGDEDKR